jgi:hypothetical protein
MKNAPLVGRRETRKRVVDGRRDTEQKLELLMKVRT